MKIILFSIFTLATLVILPVFASNPTAVKINDTTLIADRGYRDGYYRGYRDRGYYGHRGYYFDRGFAVGFYARPYYYDDYYYYPGYYYGYPRYYGYGRACIDCRW